MKRVLFMIATVAVLAFGGLALMSALRDVEPPQLYVEAPERAPVGGEVALFVSSDEPATITVSYGGQSWEQVAQDATFQLPVVAGPSEATVTATDSSGNETTMNVALMGVPRLAATLATPDSLLSGDPFSVIVTLGQPAGAEAGAPGSTARLTDALVAVDGTVVPLLPVGPSSPLLNATEPEAPGGEGDLVGPALGPQETLVAVVTTPMTVDATSLGVQVLLTDEFGRTIELLGDVAVRPLPVEVEQLQLSAATLALVTPEGRDLEAAALANAWARAAREPMWTEPFVMPIEGVNTSGFGDARRYEAGGPVSFHYGLDLAVPTGTPVLATNDGRVLVAEHFPIKGGFIAVDHGGGLMSYYLHQSKLLVSAGDTVTRGQVIGEVGAEGLATGPHLHWEMRVREEPSNPLTWAGRLLP